MRAENSGQIPQPGSRAHSEEKIVGQAGPVHVASKATRRRNFWPHPGFFTNRPLGLSGTGWWVAANGTGSKDKQRGEVRSAVEPTATAASGWSLSAPVFPIWVVV